MYSETLLINENGILKNAQVTHRQEKTNKETKDRENKQKIKNQAADQSPITSTFILNLNDLTMPLTDSN